MYKRILGRWHEWLCGHGHHDWGEVSWQPVWNSDGEFILRVVQTCKRIGCDAQYQMISLRGPAVTDRQPKPVRRGGG
jgi:hypothetical protein